MKPTSFTFAILGMMIVANEFKLAAQQPGQEGPTKKTGVELIDSADYQVQPTDSELVKLLKTRVETAVLEWRDVQYQNPGIVKVLNDMETAERVVAARLPLVTKPTERLAIHLQHVKVARDGAKRIDELVDAGATKQGEGEQSRYQRLRARIYYEQSLYHRLSAEISVLRCGGKLEHENEIARATDKAVQPDVETVPSTSGQAGPAEPIKTPEFLTEAAYNIAPSDSQLIGLLKQRANCATREVRANWPLLTGTPEFMESARRARDCRLELTEHEGARATIRTQYRDMMRDVVHLFRLACLSKAGAARLHYPVASAEVDLVVDDGPIKFDDPPVQLPGEPLSDPDPVFIRAKPFDTKATELKFRQMARADAANVLVTTEYEEHRVGRSTYESLIYAGYCSRDARLALAQTKAERVEVLRQYLEFWRAIEKLTIARWEVGATRESYMQRARYERLSAEIELLQANAK